MLTKQENLRRVLLGEIPEWVPVECPVNPRYGQGAYQFVTYAGALPDRAGGDDFWGVRWKQSSDTELPYIVKHPLGSLEQLPEFPFPDIDDPDLWSNAAKQVQDRAEALFIARQVSSLWERLYFLVGFEPALLGLVTQPDLVYDTLSRICDWQIAAADHFIALGVDAARISDDYGSQTNLLMSPQSWRTLIYPHLRRLVGHYQEAGIPVALHSCGNLKLIMDDLVELGFAAFNIQTNANDFAAYKKRYGQRFRVWGGVSTQAVLAAGPPAKVRQAVNEIVELLGAQGGLILEPDQLVALPEAHLAAFWEAAWEAQHILPFR